MKKQFCLALLAALILAGTASDASACGFLRGWFRVRQTTTFAPCATTPACSTTDAELTPACGASTCVDGDSNACRSGACPVQTSKPATVVDYEAAAVAEVNNVRKRYGLRPLVFDDSQTEGARSVSRRNSTIGYCFHYGDNYGCGEICAAGRDAAGTAIQWEVSLGHSVIMLDKNATRISVGYSYGILRDKYGRVFNAPHWTARIW